MGRHKKISGEDALTLRGMYCNPKLKETYRSLAHIFRISQSTVRNVVEQKKPYDQEEMDFPYSGSGP